jgi:hypothetical protein
VLDTVVELAFQNPEVVVTMAYALAIALSIDRVPATVPVVPGLYVTGALALAASGFYFFAEPSPSTGLERLYSEITKGVFITFLLLGFREVVKIKRG